MIEVTVRHNDNQVQVQLNGYAELNRNAAIAARNIAFGIGAHVTVYNDSVTWRVTGSWKRPRVRKIGGDK